MRLGAVLMRATAILIVFALVLCSFEWDQAAAQETTASERTTPKPPKLNARSWALVDADTGLYLAGKNPDQRLPIASTTNVMTALVALDEADLREKVAITGESERFVGSVYSNVGLIKGERLSVRELLEAALIPSGTEAVYALSDHLGNRSVDAFVEDMNQKADSMGLKNTHFENPAGLDAQGHYSSARDLATIATAAMEYPTFADIVDTEQDTITTQNRKIEVFNTNKLLYTYEEATGIKTGTSPKAGPCLIASAKAGDESYIAVVLNAAGEEYLFDAARTALEYGFDNYKRAPLVRKGEVYEKLPLPYHRGEYVGLIAARDVPGLVGPGLDTERVVTTKEAPPAAKSGQELGTVEVLVNGKSVGSSPLIAKRGYKETSLWARARYAATWPADRLRAWFLS